MPLKRHSTVIIGDKGGQCVFTFYDYFTTRRRVPRVLRVFKCFRRRRRPVCGRVDRTWSAVESRESCARDREGSFSCGSYKRAHYLLSASDWRDRAHASYCRRHARRPAPTSTTLLVQPSRWLRPLFANHINVIKLFFCSYHRFRMYVAWTQRDEFLLIAS